VIEPGANQKTEAELIAAFDETVLQQKLNAKFAGVPATWAHSTVTVTKKTGGPGGGSTSVAVLSGPGLWLVALSLLLGNARD